MAGRKPLCRSWRARINETSLKNSPEFQPEALSAASPGDPRRLWSWRQDAPLIAIFALSAYLFAALVVRDAIPTLGLAALAGLWLLHWLSSGRLSYSTPLDLPIIGLLILISVNFLISVDRTLLLPKVYGVLLSVSTFHLVVNFLRGFRRVPLAVFALLSLALLLPVVSLLATDWSGSDYSLPGRILSRLAQALPPLGRFSSGGGIHVNTVGGTLTFFVPLLISLVWDGGAFRAAYLPQNKGGLALDILYKLLLVIALLLTLGVLILTQSRGSYLGAALGFLAVLAWKDRRFLWLIPLLTLAVVAAFFIFADGDLPAFIALLDTSQEGDTFWVRLDYWQRTVFLIQDFPFTGVGLGTYGKVFDELYTFSAFTSQGGPAFYAHNMYLAIAASLGIPALVLYFALFSGFGVMTFSAFRRAQPVVRTLLTGLSSGMLAHLAYGLWDNYILGEKLALVLWLFLALVSALFVHQKAMNPGAVASAAHQPLAAARRWFINLALGLLNWLLLSLAALAFINLNAYLSLALAALGGILLGYLLTSRFTAGGLQPRQHQT